MSIISVSQNWFYVINPRAKLSPKTPVHTIQFLSTSMANAGKWRDACSDMIPQTHKNWQQIFRAGRITSIFHNACQKKDQIKCDAIILKNNLKKKKKFHHQHMNEECHCKYFFSHRVLVFRAQLHMQNVICAPNMQCPAGPESSLNALTA